MRTNTPTIVTRAEQPYVGIRRHITMQTFHEIADRFDDVFGWLAGRGVEPAGPPFFKYNVIDMERQLEVEAGVPVDAAPDVDGELISGVLPAGRYVTVTHVGHPDQLVAATGALLAWAHEQNLRWDVSDSPDGQRWGCRLELLHTNPDEEPDMNKWETQLAFRLAQ